MKLPAKLLLFFVLLSLLSVSCYSNGMPMPPQEHYLDVFIPDQKAVIYWDGNTEEMILSTKVSLEEFTDFAWVVPIQSSTKPEIEEADESIFLDLSYLFPESREATLGFDLISSFEGKAAQKVTIVETKKLDIYDITILQATNSKVLLDWLNENGYYFPEDKLDVLTYYTWESNEENLPYYFVANKINLSNKYPGLVVSQTDKDCVEAIPLDEIVLYEPYIIDYLEDVVLSEISYYDACEGANFEAVLALAELHLGISTPLKYTFTPQEPTYPMHMTSAAPGSTRAVVFTIAENCFDDWQKNFDFIAAVNNPSFAQANGFEKGKCISKLVFEGETRLLKKDSFFLEKPFLPQYDPGFNNQDDNPDPIMILILEIIIVLILFLIYVCPFAVFFFALGIIARLLEEKFKKELLFRTISFLIVAAFSILMFIMFSETFLWFPVLVTLFCAANIVAGHICFRKRDIKLAVISLVALLMILFVLIFVLYILFAPQIIY